MSKMEDGGPAFPQNDVGGNNSNNDVGMTLRDYFAAHALSGLVANRESPEAYVARTAYAYADAMLKERATR